MILKNNREPLLSTIKLCASIHHHMWIQTRVTVRKHLSWILTSVTLTFDVWPWPFAWTSLWSLVITPENFMMIQWWEHSQKGATYGQTDGRTKNTIRRADGLQLKSDIAAFLELNSRISMNHRHSAFVPPDETKFHSGPWTMYDYPTRTVFTHCRLAMLHDIRDLVNIVSDNNNDLFNVNCP